MYNQLSFLGARLKQLRNDRKLSLRQLAQSTGLSAGLLSKIENFRTVPSLPVLIRIARVLRADMVELFREDSDTDALWHLIRAGEAVTVQRSDSGGMVYNMIFEGGMEAGEFQIMAVTVPPGINRKLIASSGEVFLYMTCGDLKYQLDEEVLELHAGDWLIFDSSIPHRPVNDSGNTVSFVIFNVVREEKKTLRRIASRRKTEQ